jgi:hypothetical protein
MSTPLFNAGHGSGNNSGNNSGYESNIEVAAAKKRHAAAAAAAVPVAAATAASHSASSLTGPLNITQLPHTNEPLPLGANMNHATSGLHNTIAHTIAHGAAPATGASATAATSVLPAGSPHVVAAAPVVTVTSAPSSSAAAASATVPAAAASGALAPGLLPVNSAAENAAAAAVPVAGAAAAAAREKIRSKANFESAEKNAMEKKAEENKQKKATVVEIDVPTRGSSIFKTYQVEHEPLKNLPLQGIDPKGKLILPAIDEIYETYMIDKMKNPKDGKQYVRITYLGRDYLVRMQPMDSISDIKKAIEKAIEKTSPGAALNKLSAAAIGKPTTRYPSLKGMSLIQLGLEKQKALNEIAEARESATANKSNRDGEGKAINESIIKNDRVKMINSQMKSSLELLTTLEFTTFYQQAVKAHADGKMPKDQLEPYKKEKLLRDEEQRTFAITNINDLKPKDIPIELGRIERQRIRDGKSLNDLHTDTDPDAKRYRDIRVVFASKLADNSKSWWQDWKGPEYNRYRTSGQIDRKTGKSMAKIYETGALAKGGYTAKKSKKNNKTKKSTRRSS